MAAVRNSLAKSREIRWIDFVRSGGRGLRNPTQQAVGISRNDAAQPIERPGRRRFVQAASFGERLKAVAVDLLRLSNSPSTGRISHDEISVKPA
jgi:hypothetical protein